MPTSLLDKLRAVIEQHWGYRSFRPLQEEAMRAALESRDSLVVMPTGGGKSLCYQAPALVGDGVTVVVSPLIALMKDQVDSLHACGIPAVQLNSSMSSADRFAAEMDLRQGAVRLLFVSPERLVTPEFSSLLRQLKIKTFAIDEAHCISHWGHDFRPEYRQLTRIKELFPGSAIHAYTATATEQVRNDICKNLSLHKPLVLVGSFDRPNLTYRVLPRFDLDKQVREVLQRHPREAGIIYCLRKRDVDDVNALLQGLGHRSRAYHAGLSNDERRAAHDAFASEECDLIVATVAFGMGIDRSNIRFILHAAMPKSIEHYQQETGRAGRDGLEAECVLLHSGSDYFTWRSILEKSAKENDVGPDFLPGAIKHLDDIDRYSRGAVCRHKQLVAYFGQELTEENCGACDLCLGDVEAVTDAAVIAQKILSCVARVQERFGINHVIGVLRGENTERIRQLKHDGLTTYGLLKEHAKPVIRDWIYQLIGQGVLVQQGEEYPVLRLNAASWEVMRKQRTGVQLLQPVRREKGEKVRSSKADTTSWEGVDKELFEKLRQWRAERARSTGVPSYIVSGDATLRDLARVRPVSMESLRLVYGIGETKQRDLGPELVPLIADHCREAGVPTDVHDAPGRPTAAKPPPPSKISDSKAQAFGLFADGATIEAVIQFTGRSRQTVIEYLCDYIRQSKPADVEAWVPLELYEIVAEAVRQVGGDRLKPIFLALNEQVPYDTIRIVLAHLTRNE